MTTTTIDCCNYCGEHVATVFDRAEHILTRHGQGMATETRQLAELITAIAPRRKTRPSRSLTIVPADPVTECVRAMKAGDWDKVGTEYTIDVARAALQLWKQGSAS